MRKERFLEGARKALWFVLNPRLLFCVGLAWLITNGWSYILLGLGTWLDIGWMIAVSGAYLAFLWFPFSPEKIATFAISLALLKRLFPNDTKTLAVLRAWHQKAKNALRRRKEDREQKKRKRYKKNEIK